MLIQKIITLKNQKIDKPIKFAEVIKTNRKIALRDFRRIPD
jgi:hypothetical protein